MLSAAFPPTRNSSAIPQERQLRDFCQRLYVRTEQQATLGRELFTREPWDLFFLQLDALHEVQRVHWRYSDPGDPTYPGRSEHTDTILDFYRLFDQIIGRFRSYMERESVLLVVSGHGLGRGCVYSLHLNEWLRTRGLLTPQATAPRLLDRRYLMERVQYRSLQLLTRLHLQDILSRQPYYPPQQHVNDDIDRQETVAQVVGLADRSPFGGIILNREKAEREGYSYEQLCKELLHDLGQLRVHGQPVVNWVRLREDYYQGRYCDRYPDILFELRSAYCVSDDLYRPLVTPNLAHRVVSGNSRMSGVLLLSNIPAGSTMHDTDDEPTVMDVAPTILSLLGATGKNNRHDGQALVSPGVIKPLLPVPSSVSMQQGY